MNGLLIHMFNIIVNLHYGSLVTTPVAIVWRRENGDYRSVVLPLITLHDKLMGPGNEVKIVDVGELFGDVLTERVSSASRRNPPTTPALGG